MAIHIGIVNSLSNRWRPRQFRFSKKHILAVKRYSFLINHRPMPLYLQMLSKHSKWINPMVASSAIRRILLFQPVTHTLNFAERFRKWQLTKVSKKACNKLSRSKASMSWACAQNVLQSALGRMTSVAWHGFSANKKILWTKSLCSRSSSRRLVTNAFSFPSSTASLIQLKW